MDGRAPGAYIEFVEPPPALAPTRVDVVALVCVTERGPVDAPTRVGSWRAFAETFGEFVPNGLGAYAAKAYFDGGGGPAWVVRAAAPVRTTTTTGIQPADRASSVVAALDGLVVGAVATLSQPGIARDYLVTAVDAGTGRVTWDRPLHPDLNLALTLDVATGASAAAVGLTAGGLPAITVTASSPGAWGDQLEVVSGPGRRVATATRPGQPSGSLVTAVQDASGFRVGDACRITQDAGGGPVGVDAVVAAVDAAQRLLSWTAPLPGTLVLTSPFTIEAATFALAVLRRGAVVETWPDLSSEPSHPAFAEAALTASRFVRCTVAAPRQPDATRARLAGGRDGTAALTTADLIGDELADVARGLATLVEVEEPGVIAIPDLVAAPTPARVIEPPPPVDPCDPCGTPDAAALAPLEATLIEAGASFGDEDVVAAQRALIEHCERNTERIALLDPPHTATTLAALRGWAARHSSSYAVTTAPWVTVVEPANSAAVRAIPASGHLAGLIAACDAAFGPWLSPANRTLPWAHGVTLPLDAAAHAVANDDGINVVRALPGRGLVPLGSRTLSADAQWRFVSVRRAMIFLRRTLRLYLAWVPFEPNDAALASLVSQAIAGLLTDVWEAGGLAGATPDEAFALAVDQSAAASGRLVILVGVALARPAEFVLARVTRTGNRLEIAELPTLVPAGGA